MSVINKVDLSNPIENFVTKQGGTLFSWAEDTWKGFVREILQLMEKAEISDQIFVQICNQLAKVHSAPAPAHHAEKLKDWAALVKLPLSDIKAWEAGEKLPAAARREEILRQMLQELVEHMRELPIEVFLSSMVYIVNVEVLRKVGSFTIVTANPYSRSVHRLGLPEDVSAVLFNRGLKTYSDLRRFVEPPPPGGLAFSRRDIASRPKFDPVAKLKRIEGIDEEAAKQIVDTVKRWEPQYGNPASIYL